MKKNILLTAALAFIFLNAFAQLPSGLKLYMPFCGNANDGSGLNHNGTVFNATLTTDSSGNVDRAYDFNGTDARIEIADHTDLRPVNFTLSTWFYYTTVPSGNFTMIVTKPICSGHSDSYAIFFQSNILHAGIGDGPTSFISNTFPAPAANQWHHIAMTFDDATDDLKVYIDNVLSGTFNISASIFYDNTPVVIGADLEFCVPDQFFSGKIDEVMLFDRALTATEVSIVYNAVTPCSVGISESVLNVSSKLYPNPATDHLNIALGSNNRKVEVTITDIAGKIIYSTTATEIQKLEVNTTDFAKGVYVVQIQAADFIETKKLIVEK